MTVMPNAKVAATLHQSSEGRWPRIYERSQRPSETRVAMLSLHTSPLAVLGRSRDAGGMNVYIRELATHLGRIGTAVDVFTRWTDPTLPQIIPLNAHARLIHIPAGPIAPLPKDLLLPLTRTFTAGVECFAVSNRCDYDLIHSHYWLSGVAGLRLARHWGAPHLMMFHTLAKLKQAARPEEQELPVRAEREEQILRQSDRVIVATEDEREQIARLYGVASCHLRTIPCGVDLERFAPDGRQADRLRLRQSLHLDDAPVILAVGRLDPLKGADILMQSVARMHTSAQLVLLGGDANDPERARLQALAADLGLTQRLRFVDAVPHEALPAWYRGADVLAVASHYESFGLVAVEALACGTPVVASQVGGLPSIVQDNVNGALVPTHTPEAFAARFDELLHQPTTLARLAANARPSVQRFGWAAITAEVAALYGAVGSVARAFVRPGVAAESASA
jgi:D-inositol-3-phosphate glycosyltransferase